MRCDVSDLVMLLDPVPIMDGPAICWCLIAIFQTIVPYHIGDPDAVLPKELAPPGLLGLAMFLDPPPSLDGFLVSPNG